MSGIPIPARCLDRPTLGGRVVPHVSVVLADGRPVLGAVHKNKAMQCVTGKLCQVCGGPLGYPIVVLVSDENAAKRYSSEAALCPPCAAYSQKACPVMAGDVTVYREVDRAEGTTCSVSGCGCDGWVDADPDRASTRGKPVGRWWAVWLRSYAVAVDNDRVVHGLGWTAADELRRRPVPGTHQNGGS